jgi:hypothetical protein
MAKAAFNKKMALFTSKLDLHLRRKLVKRHIGAQPCVVLKSVNFGKYSPKNHLFL